MERRKKEEARCQKVTARPEGAVLPSMYFDDLFSLDGLFQRLMRNQTLSIGAEFHLHIVGERQKMRVVRLEEDRMDVGRLQVSSSTSLEVSFLSQRDPSYGSSESPATTLTGDLGAAFRTIHDLFEIALQTSNGSCGVLLHGMGCDLMTPLLREIMQKIARSSPAILVVEDLDVLGLSESDERFRAATALLLAQLEWVKTKSKLCFIAAAREIDNLPRVLSHSTVFDRAIEVLSPSTGMDVLDTGLPPASWQDVGGYYDVRRCFEELVQWPMQHKATMDRLGIAPPSGLLLYGPSGCGKSLCVRAFASSTPIRFIAVRGPEIFSKYLGEAEQSIRRLFQRARKASPCVIFLDELDALASRRGNSEHDVGVGERILTQLLSEIDGVQAKKEVLLIGCTNRPDLIDEALLRPGRLDTLLYVGPPSEEDRATILRSHAVDMPFDPSLDVQQLAEKTVSFSGADLASLCREAALEALAENASAIRNEHFERILSHGIVQPSLGAFDSLRLFNDFRNARLSS